VKEAGSIKYDDSARRHSIEFAENDIIDRTTKKKILLDDNDLLVDFMIKFFRRVNWGREVNLHIQLY